MLFDFYTNLITSCPQYVRHMGYLYEIIAMRSRHRRNQASWMPHLLKKRRLILSAAKRRQKRNKVVILGSGLLLDVPLLDLTSMFREVVLADIVFLPEIRRTVKRNVNVTLLHLDMTNLAQKLYENVRHGMRELPETAPPRFMLLTKISAWLYP